MASSLDLDWRTFSSAHVLKYAVVLTLFDLKEQSKSFYNTSSNRWGNLYAHRAGGASTIQFD